MEPKSQLFGWPMLARIFTFGLMIFLVWKSIDVFILIVIALIMAASLYPIAKWMNKKLPMIISVIAVIILLLIPIILLITVTSVMFTKQFPQVLSLISPILAKFHISPSALEATSLLGYVRSNLSSFLSSTEAVGLAITAVLTSIFLTFYFMLDAERLFTIFIEIFPKSEQKKLRGLLEEIGLVVGQYIRGNLIISVICIGVIYGGLAALQIPFALPIAIFTGILDLLPVIGPILGAVPALVLGFAISPVKGVLVLALYLAYKEVEDVAISPAIYNKALNLSPALIFLSVVIGAGVFGIIGAFLALPVAASIPVLIRYREQYLRSHSSAE